MSSLFDQRPWEIKKIVLPQHSDHAGVMWHGSYLSWMEEARINALMKVGLPYSKLSLEGYEMPVVSLEIKYKIPLTHGDQILLKTWFLPNKGPKLPCRTIFEKIGGIVAAESWVDLVVVSSTKGLQRLDRNLPENIKESISSLQKGSC